MNCPWRALAIVATLAAPGCSFHEATVALAKDFRIEARVGPERGTFLFDTGFTLTTIRDAAADRWRLAPGEPLALTGTDANGVSVAMTRSARVASMEIGALRYEGFAAPVLAFPEWFRGDGVVGANQMSPLAWIVDAPGGVLHVTSSASLRKRLDALYPGATWTEVPLRRADGAWHVDVAVDGRTVTLHLDTGASGTSLTATDLARLALPDGTTELRRREAAEAERIRREMEKRGLTGTVEVEHGGPVGIAGTAAPSRRFLAGEIRFGRAVVPGVLVSEAARAPGLLGVDVLGAVVWALDGPGGRLLVRD